MRPNHEASATLVNVILPRATAMTAPMMMPRRTEMLATKPLAKRAIMRIETSTEGTRILTELKKPTWMPLQFSPVQAADHAFTQASMLGAAGRAMMLPRRISSIGFSDVTTIT